MTPDGGALVYGGSDAAAVAEELHPFPLKGQRDGRTTVTAPIPLGKRDHGALRDLEGLAK
jgi:hypothetical protein